MAYFSVRLVLLIGEFEYEKLRILDDTHLKYFIKKSIISLLDSAVYCIDIIDSVSKGILNKTVGRYLSKIGLNSDNNIVKVFNQPKILADQYIITANSKKPRDYSLIDTLTMPKNSFR